MQFSFSAAKHYSNKPFLHLYVTTLFLPIVIWRNVLFFSFASEETPALLLVSADSIKTKGRYVNKTAELVTPKGKKKKDSKDEIQIEVTTKLGGINVTVTSVEGDLTHVIVGGEGLFTSLLTQCCRKLRVVCVWFGPTTIIYWCTNEMLQFPIIISQFLERRGWGNRNYTFPAPSPHRPLSLKINGQSTNRKVHFKLWYDFARLLFNNILKEAKEQLW